MKHSLLMVGTYFILSTFLKAEVSVMTEISVGELIDKITILQIKAERITHPEKRENIQRELETLLTTFREKIQQSPELNDLIAQLRETNEKLWDIEDAIREEERNKAFGQRFVELARSVYFTNDQRCKIKRTINQLIGSRLIEEKSYKDYINNTTESLI